jgi:enoyl-CoA hydratase
MPLLKNEGKGVISVILDRPEVFNALDFSTLNEVSNILNELEQLDIRAVIITGVGKSFCSGADLKEILTFSPEQARGFSLKGHEVFQKIQNFPCPVIAAVNGYALGGGLELACACDLIYGSDNSKFGQPEAKVGMITGWGGTFRLSDRIGIGKAKELVFTGKVIDSSEAFRIGLLDAIFPSTVFMDKVLEIGFQIAANAPVAVRLEKQLINQHRSLESPEAMTKRISNEAEALFQCVSTEDQKEGVRAFLEKRIPEFHNR